MDELNIEIPISDAQIKKLEVGDYVNLTGTLYTARDTTHIRIISDFKSKKKLPFKMNGSVIYYAGPAPGRGGKIISSCGPTTSIRMESYLDFILSKGVKAIIGKGPLSAQGISLLKKYNAVYFVATGGAAAYLGSFVTDAKILEYKELGPEAIFQLEVKQFPCFVGSVKGKSLLKL